MKRLGLFFVVFLCLGVFFAPNKGLAQSNGTVCDYSDAGARDGTWQQGKCISNGTSGSQNTDGMNLGVDQMNAIVSRGLSEIHSVSGYNSLPSTEKNKQDAELYTIASRAFGSINAYSTYDLLAVEIYSDFNRYLGATASGSTGERSDIIGAQVLALNSLINIYSNALTNEEKKEREDRTALKNADAAAKAAAVKAKEAEKLNDPCKEKNALGIPDDISGCVNFMIGNVIKTVVLSIVGVFLWAAANFLNFGIQVGILNFSTWAPAAIYPLWQIVRQIVSLCIIFAGLYMGFMYIIRSDSGSRFLNKYIPWLILFALFVNFSYPISRAAIDISNVISLNIYAAAVGGENLQKSFGSNAISLDGPSTAGGVIMDKLGLQGLVFSATGISNGGVNQINGVAGTLLTIIFILYATYIFGFAALLIMIRNIVLVFGIIGSPLLFVDAVVPKFGEVSSRFRKFFFEQLALSVVFMIMLYFTIAVMGVFNGINIASMGAGGDIASLSKVLIGLLLLHLMLKVTRSFSGAIGTGVEGLYKTAALGVVGGGAALAGRATLGRFAANAVNKDTKIGAWMDSKQGTSWGRGLMSLSSGVANSTFDARNSGAVRGLAGMGGIDIGKGTDKTYGKSLQMKQEAFATKYNSIKNKEARQEFATGQTTGLRGSLLDGRNIAAPAFAKDEEEAMKMNKVVDNYDKKSGADRQKYFNNQSNDVRDMLTRRDTVNEINKVEDEVGARKVNQELKSYDNSLVDVSDQFAPDMKQLKFNELSREAKDIVIEREKGRAVNQTQKETVNTLKRSQEDSANSVEYVKPDLKQAHSSSDTFIDSDKSNKYEGGIDFVGSDLSSVLKGTASTPSTQQPNRTYTPASNKREISYAPTNNEEQKPKTFSTTPLINIETPNREAANDAQFNNPKGPQASTPESGTINYDGGLDDIREKRKGTDDGGTAA